MTEDISGSFSEGQSAGTASGNESFSDVPTGNLNLQNPCILENIELRVKQDFRDRIEAVVTTWTKCLTDFKSEMRKSMDGFKEKITFGVVIALVVGVLLTLFNVLVSIYKK